MGIAEPPPPRHHHHQRNIQTMPKLVAISNPWSPLHRLSRLRLLPCLCRVIAQLLFFLLRNKGLRLLLLDPFNLLHAANRLPTTTLAVWMTMMMLPCPILT